MTAAENADEWEWRTEVEFIRFVKIVLLSRFPDAIIDDDPILGDRLRTDLIMHLGNDVYIIEVKRTSPLTGTRIQEVREQILKHREAALRKYRGKNVRSVLAIPGVLSADKVAALSIPGIEIWDKAWLEAAIDGNTVWGLALADRVPPNSSKRPLPRIGQCVKLRRELTTIQPGRPEWSNYQRACMEIWEILFYPDLGRPISESANETGVNRRDFVVPNYASDGFWEFMRNHYHADYVVVDAKNLAARVTKNHMLQISNYMSRHGTGLFGVIMTRHGIDRGAHYTRREQWVLHNKMLIVLNDDDVVQMLDNVIAHDDPSLVIRQKIEDFRLSL